MLAPADTPYSTCWVGSSDCAACPNPNATINFDTVALLTGTYPGAKEFGASMQTAQGILKASPLAAHLGTLDSPLIYHTSLNYFCCHSKEEHATILDVLNNFSWPHLNLRFAGSMCNWGPTETHVSMYALADAEGQAALGALAKQVALAVEAAGVPINHPRAQAFHSTLGTADLEYDTDTTMAKVNASVPAYNSAPLNVSFFFTVPDLVAAAGDVGLQSLGKR